MKNALLYLFIIIFSYQNAKAELINLPQVKRLLYADCIVLGKVSKMDSTGFWIKTETIVVDAYSCLSKKKNVELFVTHDIRKKTGAFERHSFSYSPTETHSYIFTLKYNETNKTLQPFYYGFGIDVFDKTSSKPDSCNVQGKDYSFAHKKDVIKSIQLLHQSYKRSIQLFDEKFVQIASDEKIKKSSKSNATFKKWVEYINYINSWKSPYEK